MHPEADSPLVDRVYVLAESWGVGVTAESIAKLLEVRLSATDGGLSGTSMRWPVVVTYFPTGTRGGQSLHLSWTDSTGVTLADVEQRFGPPTRQIKAKESLAEFGSASGVRILVSLLGGLDPSSPVARLRLEDAAQKPSPEGDF